MTRGIEQTASILREVIAIIMALAFTNSILVFLTSASGQAKSVGDFKLESVLGFIALISAIIRFYHGNHAYLKRTYSIHDYIGSLGGFAKRLVIDFVFIFVQAVVFCALSHYQDSPKEFYSLFTILFYVDSVWFFFTWLHIQRLKQRPQFHESERDSRTITSWMVANFITASIMLAILLMGSPNIGFAKVVCFFLVLVFNTFTDYSINWDTYFPGGKADVDRQSIFLSARLTTAIDVTGEFDSSLKKAIMAAHEAGVACGFDVLSAHKVEKFGKALDEPDEFVKRDLRGIADSQIVLAVLDKDGISSGVSIELGWASLLSIPIVLAVPHDLDMTLHPMVQALGKITRLESIRYASAESLHQIVADKLNRFRA